MRIEQLELSRYGCFTDRVLDLSGPGVQLVIGPNEAGKSTVRRAIGDLLYGIPERTTLGFVHDMRELRLAARLRGEGGGVVSGSGGSGGTGELDVVRLKQRKEPLQSPEGEPLAENVLGALLAGIGRAEFESTFAIDHEELRRGGQQLLKGEGDLGTALFETRSNRQLTELLDALDGQMGELFKRNAQKPTVNAALSRIADARKQVSGSLLRPADYDRVARAKEEAGKKREQLREELRRAEADHARLKRTLDAKPLLADLARLEQERAELEPARFEPASPEPSDLEPDSLDRNSLEPDSLDESAPTGGPAVLRLGAELAAVRERVRTTEAEAGQAETRRAAVRGRLAELSVDEHVLAADAEIERLHADRKAVQEAAEQEQQDRERAGQLREKAATLLGGALSEQESGELASVLRAALKAVPADLLSRTADRAKQVTRLERSVRTLREKHALPDTVTDWPALPVPAREQIAVFKELFSGLDDRQRELTHRSEEADRTLADARRSLATVLAGDPPPSEPELAAARIARDEAWLALRDRLLTPDAEQVTNASACEEYASAVRHADALADRMRREAQRQTERVRLEVAVDADEQALAGLKSQLAELDQSRQEARERWLATWLPSALPAPEPAAGAELLAAVESLAGKAEELAEARSELDDYLAETATAEARLRQTLHLAGGPTSETPSSLALDGANLAELLDLAEHRRTGLEAVSEQRAKADALLAQADELESVAAAKAERAEQFALAVSATFIACSENPAAQHTATPQDPFSAVAALRKRLLAARQNAAAAGQLKTQDSELGEELARTAETLRSADADVARLLEAAGAEDESELDELVERAAAAADLDRQIKDLTSLLTRTGVPLATLIVDAADWPDPDALTGAVADLAVTLSERQAELDAASEEFGSRSTALTAMDGSAAAAEAAEHLAEQQAVLIEHSEEYLRLYLGRELLRQCVEEYQKANQDPVLARGQELFATLTGGRFTQLTTDLDSHGRDVLRVRRASGAQVNIGPELSEGTLDQLYLALRLAALQRYADAGRTMPLVFDDIFMTSDDTRTAAGLTALDGIADQFQVIVFTHHGHLADLARKVLPAGRVHITELPAS
jgi:uncharacterized protein YhaN